ncbi:MAG: hypothetical protein M0Q96_04575, partial [Candidatus Omnitrophica bacterium]|nr:hypothetical protein [Candidatus Omnitrophota bacterium]
MRRIIGNFLIYLLLFLFLPLKAAAQDQQNPRLLVFVSAYCQKCAEAKDRIIPLIQKEFSGKLTIEYKDNAEIENYKMMLSLAQSSNVKLTSAMPIFYLRGKFLQSEALAVDSLRNFVNAALNAPGASEDATPNRFDLKVYFQSFMPLAIIIAGLEDGINPCAFTVLVFFISFLIAQGYRKRELVLIGASFILSVFLTYLLIGLGIFNFLYRLKSFWLFIRGLNIAIGSFCLFLGVLAVYDFIKFKKSGLTDSLILQLPLPVKQRIHQVISFFHRKSPEEKAGKKAPLFKLALSTCLSGFLVSLLEAVCTGQVYLPTIAFVLKSGALKLQAFAYLLLYNLMFIFPLLVIFILALAGATSGDFARFLNKHLAKIKLLMAV